MTAPVATDTPQRALGRHSFGIDDLYRRPKERVGRFQVIVFENDETLDLTAEPKSICVPPDLNGLWLMDCSACLHTASDGDDVEIMLCLNDTSTELLTSTIVVNSGARCSGDESAKIDLTNAPLTADCDEIIIRVDVGGDAVGLKVNIGIGPQPVAA